MADESSQLHVIGLVKQVPTVLLIVCCVLLSSSSAVAAEDIVIAEDGEAKLPIVISPKSDEATRKSASDLADYLKRISGASFQIVEGTGAEGLVVGLPESFKELPVKTKFDKGPFKRDHYRLVSTDKGLYLLGASPNAVAFAVWDLLYRFGYRYYFPTSDWEIVPQCRTLKIAVDDHERPDFYNRSGPRGGIRISLQPWLAKPWAKWRVRNRILPSFDLHTGHAYGAIIKRNQAAFRQHPEYLALVNGKRGGSKFCISNPALRQLVVSDAVAQINANPERDSVSLDPSDGGGWCQCDTCRKMGSVTDRVVLLANQTAEAINKLGHGDKYVGIYAYNEHSLPPTIKLHPKVIPSLATAFIKGDQTFDSMLRDWSVKSDLVGIREYYGLTVWHQSMPGTGRAGAPGSLAQSIRDQYAAGARFINAESDNAWGPHGLGYYVASRLLWDVKASEDDIVNDFLSNCFGEVKETMREFYEFMGSGPRSSDHMVGTMYRILKRARQQAKDPAVIKRIDDLVLYTRYVELYRNFTLASTVLSKAAQKALNPKPSLPTESAEDFLAEDDNSLTVLENKPEPPLKVSPKQQAFDDLVRFLWRSRKTTMADAIGMFWYLNRSARKNSKVTWIPFKASSQSLPPERLRANGEKPFAEKEIMAFIDEGIKNNNVLDFTPLDFTDDLVPAKEPLGLPVVPNLGAACYGGSTGDITTRGGLVNYTWVADVPCEIRLELKTGLVYNSRGPARVSLAYRSGDDVVEETFHPLETIDIPEDGNWHPARFIVNRKGLYRITISERMSGTQTKWPKDLPRTIQSNGGASKQVVGRHSWYFYVPKGMRIIGAYNRAGGGAVFDPDGKKVLDLGKAPTDFVSIPVPKGQDGRLWSVQSLAGRFRLLNVPPYAAGSAADLLLPRSIVSRDQKQLNQEQDKSSK